MTRPCPHCGAPCEPLQSDVDDSVEYVCPTHGAIDGPWATPDEENHADQ